MADDVRNNSKKTFYESSGNKQQLRCWAKELRKNVNNDSLSKKLVDKLKETDEYKQASHIMLFYPLTYEVNLLEIIDDHTKEFYLPKIVGDDLVCCHFRKDDELSFSCFKTKEPVSEPSDIIPDLVIVPALVVDKNNYRLGYGGGYYDRFLAKFNCKTIVCIAREFLIDTIYPEKFDVPIDKVIFA